MAERPLYTLYKNLKAQNYDVPDDYNKFESALTRDGKGGADNRHAIYENLKAQNFDVPSTYERFYSALFEPRSKTSSRAKGGSVPMSAADRARFSAGAAAISASAQQTMNNAGRYNRLKQRKQKQQKDFGRVNLGTHQTPYGGDANNVVKDDFAYNPETGKAGAYVTSDNENVYSQNDAEQKQAILDEQNNAYQQAVDTGEIPSAFDVRDKNGNYDLQENINKNGTYLTEEGSQKQFDKKLADAYARKKEIEALIAEDNRQHGNPLLSYGASIGASNGRTAEQSDYRNKLATSLSLVTEQIGALEAVKQYPTSSWGEDALKALDNTAFTAKTWDFGLTDFATMGQMERIKTKMDNNIPLSGSDKMLLKSKLGADAAAALEDEKMGNIYRWTKIAGQSLPFMFDFFLTGGYGGITKGISRGALKFAAKRGMGKVSAAILKNTGIVAGDVIGSYAMAGTEQALKTGSDIMKRHLGNLYQDEKGDYKFGTFDENGNLLHEGGESMSTALYKGLTSAMVENYTEKLFGHNYGIKKGAVNFMEKHGMNASAEFFKNIGKSGWYTNSKKWMEKFGINGFAEEVMEEEIGIPLHALLDGEGKVSDILDARQQLDIIGGMAISVGSMYAMGAGSRPVKGIYNRAQYYRFRNKVNVADSDAENLMGDNWADIKDKIDNATNEQMGSVLADILRQRDTMTKEQINAAVNYGVNLMKMRGYNIAKTAEMNAKEITNEPTTPEEQHQADIDNAYSEGHDADDADKHDIQIQQEDQMKTLAAALGISEQQLSAMSDEELESLTGQDDKLDQAIYDYQLSSARYQGVVDDAQDKVDLAAHQAEQRVDMYTDQSRGSVRNATIKASGGLEDYGVYIISGNIATHDDGSIDVSNSDDMILYYDPTTNSVEHADALMFAELGEELPADDVKAQAVSDAKENAIKEVAGIIDGTVEVGSQFNVTDTDGTEHTYEVLADYGDGTAAISIDGNVVENPYSLADLQQMKDLEDQKRLEAAKAEREQMEKERAAQQNQETEQTQPSFDFNQILNDNGNVVLVDVLDKDGNTKYPDSRLFLIRDAGAKAKVVELKSDGTLVPHAVNKEDVATISSMSLDEYKQAMPESSMIEDNSGENRGEIEVEAPTIEGEVAAPVNEVAAPESAETPATEQTPAAPAITLEDGTIVPMLEDGNPDFSKLTAAQTAELYDNQFGEDADSIVSGYVSDAKKALDKASNMTVKGKTFVEQKAAKDAKEKAIADAKAAYDSAIAIRDAYNERQLAKVEDTAEGRKELIEKARRKFARLKSAVKDDAEAVAQIYKETVGTLLHRLYDGTGIDVTDTIPLTAEEYVASNLGAHSLNYEGTETSKGVKQETGLSREDFAKTQLLAADGKGTTIDALVHSLWENRPSNLESLDTQDIRNALIGVLNSGFKASEARNFVENIRIAQAENILEEQKRAQENAAYAEQHKAEPEAELKAKSDEKAELKAKSEAKLDNESDNKSNDLSNESDNEKINDNINDNINVPEDATDEAPLGAQRDESDLPFSAKENGKQQTTAERAADVEKNKVDDMKVVDNIVGEKTRKAFERLSKMMGATIQWQYSDKLGNGWIQETTDADGNVHRTIFITLDSSITEGAQFIFGHEMTHQIKNLNPAAYNELTQLVLDTYGSDAFDKAVDETMQRYSDAGFSGRAREYYAEEVVADSVGEMIRDLNLAHTLAMKMSHPLLAAIHEILQKIKLAFFGTEYSDVTKNIIRSIEQAYVKTANGEVTNSETGEDVSFSLRQKPEPKKKGVGYKVFVLKDGKLYPPMVANPDGAATPVGVWLDADAAPIAGESKTGRPQVKQGGKGTQGGSGKLAYRPGWHLGVVPYAIQFNRKDAEGNKTLFPKNFVFAEVEYAADVDYQEEARQEGINPSGKYQHSLAGLKHLPTDGYYMYRTNPNPETDPWVITGAMKVNRILTRVEQADLVSKAGREPQQIQEGDIVTDDVVNSINQEIADTPKFSLKVYHGSGADFTEFDFDHMGEGAGSQVFGWGGYVTSSKKIGKSYANLVDANAPHQDVEYVGNNAHEYTDVVAGLFNGGQRDYDDVKEFLQNGYNSDKDNARKKQMLEWFESTKPSDWKSVNDGKRNLYEVNIPEDNGSNYLEWEKTLTEKQINAIRDALAKNGVDISSFEKRGFKLDLPFKYVYTTVLPMMMHSKPKDVSKFLSSLGFTGIKYPAGTIMGGVEEGDTNYVIFKPEDMKITQHTKFSLKSKPVRFETGKKLSDEEKKEVLSTLKDAYKVNGVPYHIEETAGGKEKRVYEPTADSYVVSDITNRPLRYYITLPDGRVAHPTEVYPNISDNEVKSSATKQGLLDDEADQIVSAAIGNMKGIADNAKVLEVLTEMQNLPHETHDVGYGMNNAQSYNYKTGIFTSDAAQAIDYVVRRMRRKEDVPAEIPAALKKAVDDSYGMVDNLIDGMSNTKVGAAEIKPVGVGAFGNIYNQFRGKAKAAIEFLKKVRGGEAVGALYHKDIGDIDLVWGKEGTGHSDGYGLSKLVKYHPEVLDNLQEILNDMRVVSSSKNRVNLESETHKAGVRLTWDGERKSWLLTAFKKETSASDKRTDTAATSLEGDTALSQTEGSAAKIDNSSETTKKNGEKFSLKDEKTMFGMHNISVDKLRKAIKQGGFAAPSMGVVDSKNGIYSDYGEITLIPKAEKLAKRTGKNAGTFTADAWTPTYPQVERIMNKQGEKVFNTDMNVKLGDVDNGIYSNVRESWKGYLSSGDVRDGLYWHYLFDNGMNPETIYQTGKYDNDITNEVMRISDNGNKTDYTDKEVAELIQLMNKATGKDNDVDAQREKLKARIASAEKQGNHLLIALKKKRLEELEGVENFYVAADFVNDVVRNNRKNGKVDVHDTMGTAKKKVEDNKKLSDDFPSWLDKKTEEYGVEEMLYNGTTPSGKPKYIPNTIENAVKLMKKQGVAGGYTAFGSELGVFIAKNSPEVNTLAAMKNAKDKLIPFGDERHNQIKDKITKEFLELSDEIRVGSNNRYAFDDSGVSRMVELTDHKGNEKEYLKKAYNIEVSDEWMDRYNKLLDTIKKDYKVFYFETKFMRPYGLDEFEKAIVPSDTPSDVIDALKKAGIDVSSYERGNAEDRQKVTMDAINSSDNIRFSLAGERGAAAADKAEERTIRMDNLSVAKDMEKNKKKAKAIKAATGWERGADGKWRYEMPDAKIKDTMDVGGGHIVKRYEDDMLWNGGKLFDVIDAPELFKAYPQLKGVRIDTDAIMNDMPSHGEYDSKTNTITIHADELKYMNDILNHEIQHAIQGIEGFATGGSPTTIRGEVKKRFNEVTKQIKQLRAEGKEDEAKALIEKNRGLYDAYMKNDDFNSYKSLAGEVEARNVQERMNMTPEERRKTLAESTEDVARKDQIFLGVGDVSFSLRDMADGKESGAADMAEDLKSLNTPDEVDDAIKTAIEDMPSGWKMANKKMIHIAQALGENRKAEIAGEEPKFSLKDGTLIKAGTYFSGGGLVEEGLKGIIDPVVAVEYDEKISGVYRNNFGQHIVTADVRDVDPKELVKQIDGEVEYFHASPVCKNYSQAKSNHAEVELDKETAASTAEFINAIKPKVVTIENVKGYKDSEAMKTITDALDANGYTWDADVYNAADYGGYTNRERLIVRAVRDGKLPAKPEKMARKSGWYEAVADIIPTLTEKKNGVAPWMDIRLKADGIDWRNIDKPLYVMGSAYADGKVPHAFADELLPTLRTKSGDVIVMPDGKVYRAMGRVLARVSGVSDDYKMPFSENLSHIIIGNGIPTQLTEHVIAPLLTGSDPKFSIRTYHGTGASFDKFDFSHMGEGEGSQAFGWGGYVTNSKDIAEDYTRRAKIRKDNGGFEFVTDMSANNKDMVRQYIYKYKDVNKGLDAMRKDLSSALEMFPDDDLKELSNILAKKNEEIAVPDNIAYLYDVDIPDDNGDYLDWDAPLTDKQKNTIIKELRRLKIDFADFKKRGFSFDGSFGGNAYDFLMYALRKTKKWKDVNASRAVSKFLSSIGFTGIKYKAGTIFGGAKEGDYNYVIFDENNANIVGNTRFSLRYDQFEHDLNQWKKDNNLPKDAQRPTIPQRNAGESAVDFLRRVDEYRKQMALWKTAPTYEQHLLSDDTALGEFNRELQRGSVLKRIAFQDSMLAIRKAQEAIMKEVGVDRLNMAEDAYTAENRSHGKGKNEFEEYNNEFLQPLRKAYHQMKKVLGDSYDNVRIYMMAKHGLERDAQMAFKKSLDADYEDVAQRSAAYKAYKGDMNRIINDSDLEFGRVDFTTWRQRDNALRVKYSPSYMDYRYDKNGIAYDYSGLSALFDGSDFEETAHKLVKDIEDKYVTETHNLWDATNAATKKILRDGYKAGMMSKDTYQYVRDMYSHYIPLRGWDGTTADQVWDYIGGGKGAFNQTLKKAHGRTSIADDPIAYIENMAESGILLNNKNWVKQHLMLLAQNHPTSLLTLSKAWYVKSVDDNGNEEWIPATPQITSQMNSNQVKAAIDAFEKKMEQMAQAGDATQKRDGLNIAYPQTHSEEREHEVRVMKDGDEYVIYVNGDPQLAQAMNNTRAHRVREIQSGKLDRAAAWLGRKMAAAYTSLSPLFIPSNYFRDLTMTLASTAIREDGRYNYLLRKNLATSWNLGFMLRDYQNGKLRDKVNNGNATPKEQMFYDFMMNGGETGFVSSLDVEDLKKKFKNDLKDLDRWKANPVKVGHTIMDSIEFLNRAIEDSNRFAVYMTSIQYGRSIDEAVNDAKDVTLNFNRKGTGEHSWQTIRNLYLFINPAVQSLQTLGALAKHHPFKFTAVTASWLASGVLVPIVNVALMQLGAAFLGGDGDDDKDWYKDISKKYWQFSKWDRRNNFIMWVPTTHEFVKIPLAQEFRAFYGLGDMIASKMMGGELAEESWEDYGWDLVGQVVDMLPLDPTGYDGNIAVSLMPNAIRPVFELAFNVDFTGKPLFKDTEYNKYDPNFTKAYVGTPDWLVRVSKMVNSIGNDYPDVQQNSIDAFGDPRYNLNNPAVVDHVLSSYLGGAYTMGSQILGVLTKSLNDPKEIKVADIPLVSKFVSNPDDRPVTKKQGDEFWDMKENHDRAANTLSKLKKQAKVDGDYSMLERFYGSEEYKQYKQDDVKVKKYEEDKKKERAEESGEEYRPHKLNAEDIYKSHATPKDDFEDLKLKQLYTKLNGFKTSYDLLVDTAPSQSDGYYNTNKAAIDAIDEISLDKQEISELKKGFLDDGKDAYNAEDMKQIRELRKKILAVLEKANKVVVANQKAKSEK
ncbi:MAG: DNA cytosine methyltransferase [Segatella copri]